VEGPSLPNLPREVKPAGSSDVLWRYSANPSIDWSPKPSAVRTYNRAVVPFGTEFAGVFRSDHKHSRALRHVGFSHDALR